MFYYLSIILMPFMMASGQTVFEKSMTGPFDTKDQCEVYKLSVENAVAMTPGYKLTQSLCKQDLPV